MNEDFGDEDGILVVDESGFAKCGDKGVGVARQYCGATGQIDNCQVGVSLASASRHGPTLLDPRLSRPQEEWADNLPRRRQAGVPDEVVFRTKPELAAELILGTGRIGRHRWVPFEGGSGQDPAFWRRREEAGETYSGEVPKRVRAWWERPVVEEPGPGRKGRPRRKPRVRADQPASQAVEEMAAPLPAGAWQRLTFREGSQGVQQAEFARARVVVGRDAWPGPELWLGVARSLDQEPKIKYYLSNAAPETPLRKRVQVGHPRWPVEGCFLPGKQEVGLDAYEVRGWLSWHHHSVREGAAGLAALACTLEQTLTDLGDRLALSPDEAKEATADLYRLADELTALADLHSMTHRAGEADHGCRRGHQQTPAGRACNLGAG
jgi:SRSO17 transposase